MSHKFLMLVIGLLLVSLIVVPVMADAGNITSSRGVTAKGPSGMLVPLGLENVMPLATALMYYNWIAVGLLFFAMYIASQRNARFFVVLVPMAAGIFAYFGWLNSTNSGKMWGMIIVSAILAVAIYMKETNTEKRGSGGPGLTVMNVVWYMILLQACVGMVNGMALFETNSAPTPSQYQNVDLAAQTDNMAGGILAGAVSTLVILAEMALAILVIIVQIIVSVVAFSVVLLTIFPWMAGNPFALLLLAVFQVIIWAAEIWFFFLIIYKPPLDGGYI